jgi:hypothetical protein
MDETLAASLALRTGVPSYQVEDEEGRIHLLIHLSLEEENDNRWCLWRPDQAGFDSRSIFDGALVGVTPPFVKNCTIGLEAEIPAHRHRDRQRSSQSARLGLQKPKDAIARGDRTTLLSVQFFTNGGVTPNNP